jgi:hypothetical protein
MTYFPLHICACIVLLCLVGHPYMSQQPMSNKSGSPRTPLDPAGPDGPYAHPVHPTSMYGPNAMPNGSLPVSMHGPMHSHSHGGVPAMPDARHELALHKIHDGPDQQKIMVGAKSDVGGFPLNFREEGVSSH